MIEFSVSALLATARAPAPESPRQHLRDHLAAHVTAVSDLTWYFDRALPRFHEGTEVRLAVEELVDHLGRAMGFAVDRPDQDDACAVWSSAALGARLLVWALDAPTTIARAGSFSRTRDQLLPQLHAPTLDRVSSLCVICGPVDRRLMQDAIVLRRAAEQVRLVTVDALMALGGLVERRCLTHEAAITVLRPQSALADPLVRMLSESRTGF